MDVNKKQCAFDSDIMFGILIALFVKNEQYK